MDEVLTFLTVSQAQQVRALVSRAFAERGVEVTIHPAHVTTSYGSQHGLWNIAAQCHQTGGGPSAWDEVISGHVDSLLRTASSPDPFADLTRESVAAMVYPRLYWWDGTTYHQLTRFAEDGSVSILVDERFQAVLETLAERAQGS
ncbi:hypothetical protein ACPCG0_09790 [Propionibacteriaceae bacterium Y1923]